MFKGSLLRWRLGLPFVLFFLCTGLNAQPIYNKKNVDKQLLTYFNGSQKVRVMEYTTDQAGLNKEYRLETLPENDLPGIELTAKVDGSNNKVNFVDKDNDGDFTDVQPNFFTSPVGAGLIWSMRGIMQAVQKNFGWKGIDNAGTSIKCELIASGNNYNAFYDPNLIKFLFRANSQLYLKPITTDVIAHEFTHGIMDHRISNPQDLDLSPPCLSIYEAFSDIFSVFVEQQVVKSASYDWVLGDQLSAGGIRNMANPKANQDPDTYNGLYWKEWNDPKSKHDNAGVINRMFYVLCEGSNGPQTNDLGTSYNCVGIGVPAGIEVFWKTMAKLSPDSDFFDLRNKTLEVVHEMGHPIGSKLDMAFREAWKSVGMGIDIKLFGQECEAGAGKTAESIYYGVVPITTAITKTTNDASASIISVLRDCSPGGLVTTAIFDPTATLFFLDTDDADQIYTLDNDPALSKKGISAHYTTDLAKEHFKMHYQFAGLDGQGSLTINNLIGPDYPTVPSGYNKVANFFKYSDNDKEYTIDQIAGTYFDGIYQTVKNVQLPESAEGSAVRYALRDIFGSEVNKTYRLSKNLEPDWTIGADAYGGNYLRSLADPTLRGQLKFYNGNGWAAATPEEKAGVWTQFYYLISNGTGASGFTNEKQQTEFFTKLPEGVPGKIMFDAFVKFLPASPTFGEMAQAIRSSLVANGYKETSSAWKNCNKALKCVLGIDFIDPPKMWAVDAEGNEVKQVDALNALFRSEVVEVGKEEISLTEVSENVAFNDFIAPVYRAFQHTTEVILPYIDEKDPGKQTTTAQFFLPGNKKLFARRRLYAAGGIGCASSIGGALECRDLEKMVNNWSPILEVTTAPILTSPISPLEHDELPAWNSILEWQATPGASGYIVRVTDLTGKVPVQDFPLEAKSDESEAMELALAKERDYSWQVIATHKLGSDEGVTWDKGLKKYVKTGLSETDIFGEWVDPVSFKTSLPEASLLFPPAPVDGEHVPPFGEKILLTAEEVPGADHYRYRIQDKKDDRDIPQFLYDHENVLLPDVSDGKVYTWSFEAYKEITLPFITEQEFGKKNSSTFIVDYSLVPAPVLVSPANDDVLEFQEQASHSFEWEDVLGAEQFDYTVSQTFDDAVLAWATGSTYLTGESIDHVKDLPDNVNGGFKWRVRAKARDEKGEWIYGPYSEPSFYWLRPVKSNLMHPSEGVQLQEVDKVDFTWGDQWAPDGFLFRLYKDGEPIFTKPVKGTSITLTNLAWGGAYAWDAPAMNITPTGTHFPEPYTFHHFTTKSGVNNQTKEVKEYDPNEPEEEESEPTDPNDPNNPGQQEEPELGKCPGFFNLKVTNSQYLSFTLTSHAIGSFDKTYGFKDAGGQPFLVACANCTVTLDEAYMENDDVEIYIKILSLASEWQDIPAYPDDETPIITITDPFGIVIGTLKMTIFNWEEGKEIYLGRYTCSKYK